MNKNKGFSLLEMSLTILIIGIVMVFGINFQLNISSHSQENLTTDKLLLIDKAIKNYILQHSQLPCPANINEKIDSLDYGKELRNSNNECYVKNSKFLSNNLIYGTIPISVLELQSSFIKDNWQNNIIYVIHKDYGNKLNFISKDNTTISLKNLKNEIITDNALYLLFSAGKNANGAFKSEIQRPISTNTKDSENSFENNFNSIFVKDILNENFDDILLYEEKNDILLFNNLADISCSLISLNNLDSNWNYSFFNDCKNTICQKGLEIEANEACLNLENSKKPIYDSAKLYKPVRKCLKYGKWSDIMYPCSKTCNLSNIYSLTDNIFKNNGELQNSVNLTYLKRAILKEIVMLECINEKVGYISLECLENGTWLILENSCINKNQIL